MLGTDSTSPTPLKKVVVGLVGVVLLLAAVYLFALTRNAFRGHDYIGKSDQQVYTITIAGEGSVTSIPDIATVSLGAETQGSNVSRAQQENTTKINNLVDRLKALDISAEDIKTTNYNIYPQYDWVDGQQILRGYQVSQNVTVKIRNLSNISTVLNLAGELDLNQVSGLTFAIDEPEELEKEAREMAIANAQEKAEELARSIGIKLGRIVSFSENTPGSPMPVYRDFAMQEGYGGGNAAPKIEAGSEDVNVYITVTYEVL